MSGALMKRFVWMLSVAALAGAVVVSVNALRDIGSVSVYAPVSYSQPDSESGRVEFPPADFYSVIWENEEIAAEPEPAVSGEPPGSVILRSVFLVRSGVSVRGFAAIEINREEHLYSEGAALAGGYKLLVVEAGRAILERNGRRYMLPLEGAGAMAPLPETVPHEIPETAAASPAEPEIDVLEPTEFDDPSGMRADRIAIPPEVRDYALNSLHRILHHVRVRTDLSGKEGGMRGIWIDPHVNSLPYKLGFRIGDIIRSIDGRPIQSIKDVMDLYRKAIGNPPGRVRIIFERNGKLRVREIEIEGR